MTSYAMAATICRASADSGFQINLFCAYMMAAANSRVALVRNNAASFASPSPKMPANCRASSAPRWGSWAGLTMTR